MNNTIEYKGYYANIEYNAADHILFGKIEGINDLVNFESDDPNKIEDEFHIAVDDYLAFCEDIGQNPEKPYKGTFNVRITPELHRKAAMEAFKQGKTLNSFVSDAIREAVNNISETKPLVIDTAFHTDSQNILYQQG